MYFGAMRFKRKLPTAIITVVAAVVILVNRWPDPVGDTAVQQTVGPFTICRNWSCPILIPHPFLV